MKNTDNESYGLEHIHNLLLEAGLKFDKICRENDICYSLHGGTLLGAERNHKFIPWDDDMDISMKRSEYKKFQEIATKLPSNFWLDEKSMWVPRLVLKKENELVCIDIFVWDYISSNELIQKIKINLLRFYQGMLKGSVDYKRFGIINKALLFITHIVGMLIPFSVKLKRFKYLCEHTFVGDKKCIHRSNDAFLGVSYVFDSTYMDGYIDIEFENHKFMVNERYHEFLERNYGADYLIPPSKDKRIPEHEKIRKDLQL